LMALRSEKPHLFKAENLPELLRRLNQVASFPSDQLFLRLSLPNKGLAVKGAEMPDLPSHRALIYTDAKRNDVQGFRQVLLKKYELPFVVNGNHTTSITINRRVDQ